MILTLTGSSGTGKTTIARGVLKKLDSIKMLTSYTTRQPRESDLPGEYEYLTIEEFMWIKGRGDFLWDIFIHGIHFGTRVQSLYNASQNPGITYFMILAPDVLATLHLYAKKLNFKVYSFYIPSPTIEVLRARLRGRGDEPEIIERRLTDCVKWDRQASNSDIPYIFIKNDGLPEKAVKEVINTIKLIGRLPSKIDF